eukprot:GFYU01008397.1.p1 GENE.GFYU01008397.1~~GFYU01008397.1.p1  ORF type:complete len:795 (-),score=163.99 GFYU01008397.1:355-2739(-)
MGQDDDPPMSARGSRRSDGTDGKMFTTQESTTAARAVMTASEEADMEMLLSACSFSIGDAHQFGQHLAKQLRALEAANIHEILTSEQGVQDVVDRLEGAAYELDKLDTWLNVYSDKLKLMRRDIELIEDENVLFEVQTTNHSMLLAELQQLLDRLELDPMIESDLILEPFEFEDGLQKIMAAAKKLGHVLQLQVDPQVQQMAAVKQKLSDVTSVRDEFFERARDFLEQVIVSKARALQEDCHRHGSHVDFKDHNALYSAMRPYFPLMQCLSDLSLEIVDVCKENYLEHIARLYEDEIASYFTLLKQAIVKDEEVQPFSLMDSQATHLKKAFAKMPGKLNANIANLKNPSLRGGRDSTITLDLGGNQNEDEFTVHRAFEQALSEWISICSKEQSFIGMYLVFEYKMQQQERQRQYNESKGSGHRGSGHYNDDDIGDGFDLSDRSDEADTTRSDDDSHANKKDESLNLLVDLAADYELQQASFMKKLFNSLVSHFKELIDLAERIDSIFIVNMLVATEGRIDEHQDHQKSFVLALLMELQQHLKAYFNRYIANQMLSIESSKIGLKRCGVLEPVAKFPFFVARLERAACGLRRDVIDSAYRKLIVCMFNWLERLGQATPKYADLSTIENMNHFYKQLQDQNSVVIQEYVWQAHDDCKNATQRYLRWMLQYQFPQIVSFFGGVHEMLSKFQPDEIQYQHSYSKEQFRNISKGFAATYEKGLVTVQKRLVKHINNEEGLLVELWAKLKEYIVNQYTHYEKIVARCYPSEQLAIPASAVQTVLNNLDTAIAHEAKKKCV